MSSRLRLIAVISCSTFSLLGAAFGQKTAIEADIKGVDGQPARAAEVRIERQDKKAAPMIVKTNWRGHLAATNLEVGTYKVTATVAGNIQSSQVVKTRALKPSLVTFDLTKAPAMANKGKKKMIWVPAPTGSMMGGGWVEVNADGSVTPGTGMGPNGQNLDTVGRGELERMQNRSFAAPAVGGR